MAELKISDLDLVSSFTGTTELEVEVSGQSKKASGNQIQDMVLGSTNGLIARTAANTTAARAIVSGTSGKIIVSNGDGVAGNPTVELDGNAVVTKGTKAAIDTLASGGSLEAGQLLYLTDEQKFAGATGTGAYAPLGGGTKLPVVLINDQSTSSPVVLDSSHFGKLISLNNRNMVTLPTPIAGDEGDVIYVLNYSSTSNVDITITCENPSSITFPEGEDFISWRSIAECRVVSHQSGSGRQWIVNLNGNKRMGRVFSSNYPITATGSGSIDVALNERSSVNNSAVPTMQLAIVETANQPYTSVGSGWTQIGTTQATGTAGGTASTALQVYYGFGRTSFTATGGGDDHYSVQIIDFKNVDSDAPVAGAVGSVAASSSTAVSMPSVNTTRIDELVIAINTHANDAVANNFSGLANANLDGLRTIASFGTTSGNGGGFRVSAGLKSAPGATGATTATLATTTVQANLVFSLRNRPHAF